MKERDIQRQIIETLRQWKRAGMPVYWLNLPGSSHLRKGTPDLLVVYRGRAVFLEIKLPGEQPTKLQQRELSEWKSARATTAIVTTPTEALSAIRSAAR